MDEILKGAHDYLEVNRALWNAKTAVHIHSAFYDPEGFARTGNSLRGPETALLGDVAGQTVLHLQCHFGQDTISIGRLGARATGLDLSDSAIAEAVKLAARMGSSAEFVCADVYSAPEVLRKKFDIVFTSYGTIGWLPDLRRWAAVIAQSLRPGGRFIMADFHPVVWMYDTGFTGIAYSYFNREPIVETLSGTYADRDASISLKEIGWNHALSDILGALLAAGIRLTHFAEYDYSPYNCFPDMVEQQPGRFMIRGCEGKLPMMYTLEGERTPEAGTPGPAR